MISSDMSEGADDAAQFTAEGLKEESAQAVVRALARTAQGVISPMCATVGGVVGQEALKAVSGKFMPIMQWLYYDAVEALPDEPLPAEEVAPKVSHL
jgi:ubiquitin-activating enzyme E1